MLDDFAMDSPPRWHYYQSAGVIKNRPALHAF
jgi:hypothetical protein